MLDKNIRAAGGNIDDLRGPMDDNWDKMLAKGPPAWFEEALDQHQNGEKPTAAKAALEDAEAALAAGPPSGGAPTTERAAPPKSAEDPAFEASAAFAGARPGQVFKTGPQGVGYYSDPAQVHRCLVDPLGVRRLVKVGYPSFGMSVLGHIEAEVRK